MIPTWCDASSCCIALYEIGPWHQPNVVIFFKRRSIISGSLSYNLEGIKGTLPESLLQNSTQILSGLSHTLWHDIITLAKRIDRWLDPLRQSAVMFMRSLCVMLMQLKLVWIHGAPFRIVPNGTIAIWTVWAESASAITKTMIFSRNGKLSPSGSHQTEGFKIIILLQQYTIPVRYKNASWVWTVFGRCKSLGSEEAPIRSKVCPEGKRRHSKGCTLWLEHKQVYLWEDN